MSISIFDELRQKITSSTEAAFQLLDATIKEAITESLNTFEQSYKDMVIKAGNTVQSAEPSPDKVALQNKILKKISELEGSLSQVEIENAVPLLGDTAGSEEDDYFSDIMSDEFDDDLL